MRRQVSSIGKRLLRLSLTARRRPALTVRCPLPTVRRPPPQCRWPRARRSFKETILIRDSRRTRPWVVSRARRTGTFHRREEPDERNKQWATLTNQQRGDKLLKYANAELTNTHVPVLKSVTLNIAAAQPSFQLTTWTLELVGDMSRTDDAYLSWLVDAVIDQSRHCEQWFRIARKLAGDGQTAVQIQAAMSIPLDIAQAAVKRPLSAQSDASKFFHSKEYNARHAVKLQEATAWHASIYGAGAAHSTGVLTAVPMDVAVYHALPEEVDAYIVGPKAAAAYNAL